MAGRLSDSRSLARRRQSAGRITLGRLSRRLEESLPAAGGIAPPAPLPPALARALEGAGIADQPFEGWRFEISEVALRFDALIEEAQLRRALAGEELRLFVPAGLARAARWWRAAKRLLRRPAPAPAGRRRHILITVAPGAPPRVSIDGIALTTTKEIEHG